MALYVLSDLHLSFGADKPMDVFGERWENHTEKIYRNWQSTVKENDTVVIPGDISWGMDFGSTFEDLKFVDSLNGRKIIGKGNHDYWWQTMKKLNAFIKSEKLDTISFLFNNAYAVENYIVCGTRGWMLDDNYSADDEKIVLREAGRLELSLADAERLKKDYPENEIVVFLHYPPSYKGNVCSPIADVLEKHGIKRCFYGHLHGVRCESLDTVLGGTRLYCVSSDLIGFKPMRV